MADLIEIAVASWRLEKWLSTVNVERKMAAKSSLRTFNAYLKENNIEIMDITGSKFDSGLAVSVVNNESDETDEEKLIIAEMVKPIVLENGSVIQYGQVILGDKVKESSNKSVEKDNSSTKQEVDSTINIAKEIENEQNNTNIGISVGLTKILACIAVILEIIILVITISNKNNIDKLKVNTSITSSNKQTTDIVDYSHNYEEINNRLSEIESKISTKKDEKEITSSVITTEIMYIVQRGDTLHSICSRFGIDYDREIDSIVKANNIKDPGVIYVGQILRLTIK
jgi:hypothetical protein